jgi:prevent-host-death family protein
MKGFIKTSNKSNTPDRCAPGDFFVRHKQLDIRSDFGTIIEPEVSFMNIVDDIKPVTYLKSRAADLLNQINETQRPVIITQNGEPRAVLQDPASYENMRNAIGILKLISQGEGDIRCGRTKPQDKMFDEIENSLNERLK